MAESSSKKGGEEEEAGSDTNEGRLIPKTDKQALNVTFLSNVVDAIRKTRHFFDFRSSLCPDNHHFLQIGKQAGGVLGAKDSSGPSILHIAAARGRTLVCKYLVETIKFDIKSKDFKGYTTLHNAVLQGHYLMTSSYLLDHGAHPDMASDNRLSPLHYAAEKGSQAIDEIYMFCPYFTPGFMVAGRKDQVKLLISKCAEVDAPLRCAAANGMKNVKILIEHKANRYEGDQFEEETCYALQFMGLPLKREGIDQSMSWGSGVLVGVIDCSEVGQHDPSRYECLHRLPVEHKHIHQCNKSTRLSNHGILCTSLIAGRSANADFFGLCKGNVRGVVPSCDIITYNVGCPNCKVYSPLMVMAFEQAISHKVHVISMSMGWKSLFKRPNSVEEDTVGEVALEAFKKGIIVCLSAGNKGPDLGSIGWGIPWCLNVGACTSGKTANTVIEVGVKASKELDIPFREENEIKIFDKIEGVSLNIYEHPTFCLLWENTRDKDSIISISWKSKGGRNRNIDLIATLDPLGATKIVPEEFGVTRKPQAKLFSEDTNLLWGWKEKYGNLYVRIRTSKICDDIRPPFVPNFSSRGPSWLYKEIMMPNVLAPGAAIVASWSKTLPLEKKETIWSMVSDQYLNKGTSISCALAAGAISYLIYRRNCLGLDRLNPSAIISAVMTTANDLGRNQPGNEFDHGAGVINIEKAVTPGLLYEETFKNMQEYREGTLFVDDLNLPSFAASFPQSPKCLKRIFSRNLTIDDEVDRDDSIIYDCFITIDHNSLDPLAEINVRPTSLEFTHKREVKSFYLTCKVHPLPRGYISASLTWKSRKYGESSRNVVSRIILYEESFVEIPKTEDPPLTGEGSSKKRPEKKDPPPTGEGSSQKGPEKKNPPPIGEGSFQKGPEKKNPPPTGEGSSQKRAREDAPPMGRKEARI